MPTYYDSQNLPHVPGKRLGIGGEGAVYSCEDPQIVAKIYHEPVTEEKAGKLRWMAVHQDEQLNKVAAWILDVLLDAPGGKVVGFLMPNVHAKEIHELYSLKSRRFHFPEATWHFLIHTAANLARAFHSLHKNNHVMGDINHGNCVVLADGTVKLIDCDSYSIKTELQRYPCEVGVTTHLAPELQGINLHDVIRQSNHDNFGLAVIIFQLLFLGRHPFAGNFLLGEDKPLEDCIREHLFAYGDDSKRVAQPPGTLSLSDVSPAVAGLFKRAFTKNHDRPSPREWIEALEDLAENLEQCSLHPGHLFYEKNALCSWCRIESQTGLMLFPIVTTSSYLKTKYQKTFDIVTIENLVKSFDIKPNLPARLSQNVRSVKVRPKQQIINSYKAQRNKNILVCGGYFLCLFVAYLITGELGCAGITGFFSMVAAFVLYNFYKDSGNMVLGQERERLYDLEFKWTTFENKWSKVAASPAVEKSLTLIRQKIESYRYLQLAFSPGSPPQNTSEEVEKKSTEDHQTKNSEEFSAKTKHLELEISDLLADLRAQSVRLKMERQKLLTESQKIAYALAQAKSNLISLGNSIPLGFLLILITIGTPILNYVVYNSISHPSSVTTSPYQSSIANTAPSVPALSVDAPREEIKVPAESIKDSEIAALPPGERLKIVGDLIRISNIAVNAGKFEIAERSLKFALRFDKKNTELLNKFGDFYYNRDKFAQALTYYNRSKEIDDNEGIEFLIGMTYLNLQKFSNARDIFAKMTTGKLRSNQSLYNLGLAYQGLGNHGSAAEYFRQALSLNQDDQDSIYQLGISFNKLGDEDEVRKYYGLLKEKDEKRAAQLKKAIGNPKWLNGPPPVQNFIIGNAPTMKASPQ